MKYLFPILLSIVFKIMQLDDKQICIIFRCSLHSLILRSQNFSLLPIFFFLVFLNNELSISHISKILRRETKFIFFLSKDFYLI